MYYSAELSVLVIHLMAAEHSNSTEIAIFLLTTLITPFDGVKIVHSPNLAYCCSAYPVFCLSLHQLSTFCRNYLYYVGITFGPILTSLPLLHIGYMLYSLL